MQNFASINKKSLNKTLFVLIKKNAERNKQIDNTSNLKDVFGKVDKLGGLWDMGRADASLIRYIPGLSNVSRQEKMFNNISKKAYAATTCTDKKTEFTPELAANAFPNYSSMCIVLPIKIKKATNKAANVDLITLNNFFLSLVNRNLRHTLSR